MRFDVLEPPRTYVKNSTHLALPNIIHFEEVRWGSMCLNHPELMWKKLYTPRSLQYHSLWGGSMRFDVIEPHRNSSKWMLSLSLISFIMRRFDEVRCDWTTPNLCDKTLHTSLSLISFILRRFDDVRCAWTIPNLCEKTLHTSLSLISFILRRFDEVRCA